MYKVKHKLMHNSIEQFFYSIEDSLHNTRQRDTFKKCQIRTALRAKCFSIVGVKLWNDLSLALRNCKNIFAFKKMHKTFDTEN